MQMVNSLPPSLRPLDAKEQELRDTWVRAICLMLSHAVPDFKDNCDDGDSVSQIYGPILGDLVAIHQSGLGLNANKFVESRKDILLPKDNILLLEDSLEDNDMIK
eukprot:CAMPEP_0194438102 /NCGR_PEP_ID=MMETSP0176-20130528/103270_1 /TAXON_ID=216777 /ORGANISM="Proboscia alata, Strain PI-D3" /LENGTH=104 /DNA_ID=CAMNT_0039259985 /DNA_START=24 /DNA_END=335 /DNA_ORIENTATION=+